MSWRASGAQPVAGALRVQRAGVLLLAAALVFLVSLVPAAAQRPNGAGLVIRHGDGTLLYIYVQFDEDSISGEELFYRSGIDITLAPFGGLGAGVCAINGEGCPSDNCFCQSFTPPAYFWHYYTLADGAWSEQIRGPSTRVLRDGDVDGWSWNAGDAGLPATSIDEIALMNGVDRNAPEPTATETPTEPPTATPTEPPATATATATPSPTVPAVATATSAATMPASPTAQATHGSAATATERSAQAASVTATGTTPPETPAGGATATRTSGRSPATTSASPTVPATTVGVAVNPSGTVTPLAPQATDDGSSMLSYVPFAALAALILAVGGFVVWRGRGRDA